jgi:long-chain acyl-CoA synthetase
MTCCEVKIHERDDEGVGEIWVKGDNVMVGYYDDPEATAAVFEDGWYKTGDYGRFDEDGFLFYVGRKKNLIVLSNGKNVSPEEIEDKIMITIPYVKEVVVSDEDNFITAEFYLDEEACPDAKERIKQDVNELNRNLPVYKRILKVKTRDTEFPKTTTLKIKRVYKD